jgi:hypothetical protein
MYCVTWYCPLLPTLFMILTRTLTRAVPGLPALSTATPPLVVGWSATPTPRVQLPSSRLSSVPARLHDTERWGRAEA